MLSVVRKQLNDYQDWALTKVNPSLNRKQLKEYCLLKLVGETGEYLNLVAKREYHLKPIEREVFKDELGDVTWYLALYCKLKNVKLGSGYKPVKNEEMPTSIYSVVSHFPNILYRVKLSFYYPNYNASNVRKDFLTTLEYCAKFHGFDLIDVLQYNVQKLDQRHSNGYNQQFYQKA